MGRSAYCFFVVFAILYICPYLIHASFFKSLRNILDPCPVTPQNIEELIDDLNTQICGQPYAIKTVGAALVRHFQAAEPSSPLVMSWHGTAGVGKTSLTKILSKFFNTLHLPGNDFYQNDVNEVEEATKIFHLIKEELQRCPRTLIVIDDADFFPRVIIDRLLPFIDGSDKRLASRAVFIFIMNLGADSIEHVIQQQPAVVQSIVLSSHRLIAPYDDTTRKEIYNQILRSMRSHILLEMNYGSAIFSTDPNSKLMHETAIKVIEKDNENSRGERDRFFMNVFHEKALVAHIIPFLPITRNQFSCCINQQLMQLQKELTSYQSRSFTLPFSTSSVVVGGSTQKAVGFNSVTYAPRLISYLSSQIDYDPVTDITFDGCRSAESIITTYLYGDILEYVMRETSARKKQEKARLQELSRFTQWLTGKKKHGFYDIDVFIDAKGNVSFTQVSDGRDEL